MDVTQLAVLAFAVAASSVIKNGAAVGSGIFLLPVLALVFPPKIALGLGAPVMLASDIVGIRNYWREWDDWRGILRVIIAATVGILLGGYFLQIVPGPLFKKLIGVFAIGFALFRLCKDAGFIPSAVAGRGPRVGDAASSLGIGFLGGVATVLAHAGGMVWSMYYAGRNLEKRRFVGTMILLFALSNLVKLCTYVQLDILSLNSTLIVLAMTPLVLAGSALGNRLNRRMDPVLFRRVVLVIILALGAGLLFS
jgi:uncharacterized protein